MYDNYMLLELNTKLPLALLLNLKAWELVPYSTELPASNGEAAVEAVVVSAGLWKIMVKASLFTILETHLMLPLCCNGKLVSSVYNSR